MIFLDRLGKAMQMDEISQEVGLDLLTDSLLVRAEQLARLETDKLVDKVKGTIDIITSFRCFCHIANVFSFVLCLFVVQIVYLPHVRSICAPAIRLYRGFGASDRSTSFLVSKK